METYRNNKTMVKIRTTHLDLVPASLELIESELASREKLASALGVRVPEGWPPGEYDRPAIEYFKSRLTENPGNARWYSWYAIHRTGGTEPAMLVGAGGFFGPPSADRVVEVGFSIVREFEGRGYATELVRALIEYAFSTDAVKRIVAHTTPVNLGSAKVLEKAGFRLAGLGKEPGTVEYECRRQSG